VTQDTKTKLDAPAIEIGQLDLAHLVGNYIKLYSSQLPGKMLRSKVLSATHRQILVNAGGEQDILAKLVNRQSVVVQFPYKGQDISVRAQLNRSEGGRCYFELPEKATPLSQRKFLRVSEHRTVKLARLPGGTIGRDGLKRLRWVETETVNYSSGGVLLSLPGSIDRDVRLLLNIDLAEDLLPPLVVGRVRHWFQGDESRVRVGVEFVVREVMARLFPPSSMDRFPEAAMRYSARDREKLNKKIVTGTTPTAPSDQE